MDVIAHRGARLLAIENTLEAFHIAWQEGADAVEMDVQVSADGEPVVFHDGTLAAWTSLEDAVIHLPWRQLREVELRDERGHCGRIAHFEEVLDALASAPGRIHIELKIADEQPDTAALVAETVAAHIDDSPRWTISSFSKVALGRFANCRPQVECAPLVHERPDWPWSWLAAVNAPGFAADLGAAQALLAPGWHAVHVHGRLVNDERLAAWRESGLKVRPWVINEARHWELCLTAGVDAVLTDDPGGLRRFLGGYQ